jgi:hypothetical protein
VIFPLLLFPRPSSFPPRGSCKLEGEGDVKSHFFSMLSVYNF